MTKKLVRILLILGFFVVLLTNPFVAAREDDGSQANRQERFIYAATIAQSPSDPDFITVIGANPSQSDFGKIVNRIDMPNLADELHHFGYSHDQKRLVVPGLFSNRIHIFDIQGNGKNMKLKSVK